ncbi:hypothetical protein CBER1_10809 [Cercospora berteroae]|uniref:Oxidoreductase n=1 Tax=Cercospora berteroae TaxID=357750 RepID=A0A2S6CJ06_9PEZI|nr:hypothetical protein CBER1_10809 [Cercospora berteroae]
MPVDTLQDRVVLVTGGASGIGFATAKRLLERGALVYLTDINEEALKQAASTLNNQARFDVRYVDVTKRDAVRAAIISAKERFGRLDAIGSIAGTGGRRLGHEFIWQTTSDEYDFNFDINVRGTFNILSEALTPGVMREPGGSIVCVGSMFSLQGFEKGAVFAASKRATTGLVKSAAKEVGKRGIRVNAVLPGAIDTPMHQRKLDSGFPDPGSDAPLSRVGKAKEVAEVIVFLLSGEVSFATGSLYGVDGGQNC